jgi:hypothetical protein
MDIIQKLLHKVSPGFPSPRPSRPPHRPSLNTAEQWQAYWKALGQPWHQEPEIDLQRQEYLARRRLITPNIEQGIYPFKEVKLSRADVEWLLATHENGRVFTLMNTPTTNPKTANQHSAHRVIH